MARTRSTSRAGRPPDDRSAGAGDAADDDGEEHVDEAKEEAKEETKEEAKEEEEEEEEDEEANLAGADDMDDDDDDEQVSRSLGGEDDEDDDESEAGEPSRARVTATRWAIRQQMLENRPKSTKKNYGLDDCSNGAKKEWKQFCEARAGDVVNGVVMDEKKEKYSLLVTPEKVAEALVHYLQKREKRKGGKNGGLRKGTRLDTESIHMKLKAWCDLYDHQKSNPATEEAMTNVAHPRTSGAIAKFLANHKRNKSDRKRKMYVDRGLQRAICSVEIEGFCSFCSPCLFSRFVRALLRRWLTSPQTEFDGYTKEQHRMLCEYALLDDAPKPRILAELRGSMMRLSHIFRHNHAVRGDSLRKLQFADWFVIDAPPDEGPHQAKLLMFVHDNGKNNPNGKSDFSASMRHFDPILCTHNALAHAFFMNFDATGTIDAAEFVRKCVTSPCCVRPTGCPTHFL